MVVVVDNGTADLYIGFERSPLLSLPNKPRVLRTGRRRPTRETRLRRSKQSERSVGDIHGDKHDDERLGNDYRTWITYDKGGEWSLIPPPHGTPNCSHVETCSLHLSLQYGAHNSWFVAPMYTKPSAPGFILSKLDVNRGGGYFN